MVDRLFEILLYFPSLALWVFMNLEKLVAGFGLPESGLKLVVTIYVLDRKLLITLVLNGRAFSY